MKNLIQIIKYSFWGCITTAINLLLFFILEYVGVYYIVANTLAYFIAVVINYIFNQKFVFEVDTDSRTKRIQLIKFILMRAVSLGVDNILFYFLVDIAKCSVYISRIGLSIGIILLTYIINKVFIFKENR